VLDQTERPAQVVVAASFGVNQSVPFGCDLFGVQPGRAFLGQ